MHPGALIFVTLAPAPHRSRRGVGVGQRSALKSESSDGALRGPSAPPPRPCSVRPAFVEVATLRQGADLGVGDRRVQHPEAAVGMDVANATDAKDLAALRLDRGATASAT